MGCTFQGNKCFEVVLGHFPDIHALAWGEATCILYIIAMQKFIMLKVGQEIGLSESTKHLI